MYIFLSILCELQLENLKRLTVVFKPHKSLLGKWLDFLDFSDKDDRLEVPSDNSLNVDNSVGRKRTHPLFEKSRVIPVLWLSFVCELGRGGWVR